MIVRIVSQYKVIIVNPTGLNVISKALIFIFLSLRRKHDTLITHPYFLIILHLLA